MIAYIASAALMLMIGVPAASAPTYGDTLADALHQQHPGVNAVRITATGKDGRPLTITRTWVAGRGYEQDRSLSDSNGKPIGKLIIVSRCDTPATADAVARELARRIYLPDNLAEPDPFVEGTSRAPFGSVLIDQAVERNLGIITLAFHVTPPGETVNRIVASNFGRIGKPADKDDDRVIDQGAVLKEVTNGGGRMAIELPLLDRRSRTIGALSTSFRLDSSNNTDAAVRNAVRLRHQLAQRIGFVGALFKRVTASRQVARLGFCK